jgi:16S rRNA (cytidine1402-2'-O)-methyltransferase
VPDNQEMDTPPGTLPLADTPPGTLLLAGAPIGDPGDASPRLRAALSEADVVAAEDTRRLARLVEALGGMRPKQVVSYFEGNETERTPELIAVLLAGQSVLLVTDAGMPSVSDPGYRLVRAAVDAGLPVTCLPGPSAVTTALALSGLPSDRFCFEGFLPRKSGRRRRALEELRSEPRTVVCFEAPHRLAEMLADAADVLGADRAAAVCRELTKTYEEVRRGGLGELAKWALDGVRGEVTVVIGGATPAADPEPAELAAAVAGLVESGLSRRDAVSQVAEQTGVARRLVYEAATH